MKSTRYEAPHTDDVSALMLCNTTLDLYNLIFELKILPSLSFMYYTYNLVLKLFPVSCLGAKLKKHSRVEFSFEATTAKVQGLSYCDRHVVTWQCALTVIEMLSSFASGPSSYLPVQEHVAFLFDLMELAFNIYGLIDVCIQVIVTSNLLICLKEKF